MSSDTSVVLREETNPLALSGYTPRKQVVFSTSLMTNVFVIDPLYRAMESFCRFVGLANTSFSARWNHIPLADLDAKLYLGGIPVRYILTGSNDAAILTQPGGPEIKVVLCMNEGFETHYDGWTVKTITPDEWKEKNVTFQQLESPDFQGIAQEKIEEGIAFLNAQLVENKKNTLVHCKAGKSRSAAIVVAFLMDRYPLEFPNVNAAMAYLKKYRNQVYLEPQKVKDIDDFFKSRKWKYEY